MAEDYITMIIMLIKDLSIQIDHSITKYESRCWNRGEAVKGSLTRVPFLGEASETISKNLIFSFPE